jgi:2-C-methyl-D-erythritol 4-phosphate cytidylyltransferase
MTCTLASQQNLWAVIPAAGIGARAGAGVPKQYRLLAGTDAQASVLARSARALCAGAAPKACAVVVSPADGFITDFATALPSACHVFKTGGATRAQSVFAGLDALISLGAKLSDWVLVHDAARCLVRPADVAALVSACSVDAVGGLLATPLADTLKRSVAADSARSDQTLDRSDKWLAQTPQMFRLGVLRDALSAVGDQVTDEASAIEALGLQPLLVAAQATNFKLTTRQDFVLAEALLQHLEGSP